MSSDKKTILVVDDTVSNLKLAESALMNDFKPVLLTSGEQALKYLLKNKPDLIILDIQMPGLDGYETLERLRAEPETADIPVIFFSALSEDESELHGLSIGAADYIVKPVIPALLLHRVRMQLELHAYRKNLENLVEQKSREIGRIQHDLLIAGEIQKQLLAAPMNPHPACEFFGKNLPAREAGGDLYDFTFLDEHRLFFAVGDVAGKGITAAMFMSRCLAIMQAAEKPMAGHDTKIAETMAWVNRQIYQRNYSSTFITAVMGVYDTETGNLAFCSGGHNPPVLIPRQGSPEYFATEIDGFILGIDEDVTFETAVLKLEPGDTVLFYTDGVTEAEAPDGSFYGNDRLLHLFEKTVHDDMSARASVETLFQDVIDFASDRDQSDDITVLALKRSH